MLSWIPSLILKLDTKRLNTLQTTLKKHTIQLFENLAVYTNSRLMFWKVRQVLLQISSAVKLT